MNFNGFDFGQAAKILAGMSEEEKKSMMDMASDMMNRMNQPAPAPEDSEEEEFLLCDWLPVQEETEDRLSEKVLDQFENAAALEEFYEDEPEADYSASVLFLSKGVLSYLKETWLPLYQRVLPEAGIQPAWAGLATFLVPLAQEETREKLAADGGDLESLLTGLQGINLALQRAEFDTIDTPALEAAKNAAVQVLEAARGEEQ